MRKSYGLILLLCWAGLVHAHIGPKKVLRIAFNPQSGNHPEVVIQNFGLFNWTGDYFDWLCDEAMTPVGGLNAVTSTSIDRQELLVGDGAGLYRSTDAGCSFEPYGPPFDEHNVGQIEASRDDPSDVLVSTQTLGVPNDVYHSRDGGLTWTSLNLAIEGRVRRLLRSPANPNYIYLIHAGGGYRSLNGGDSFEIFPMGPPELNAGGVDFDLLKIHPDDPNIVYAAVSGFPTSTLVRTTDAGSTWQALSVLDDIPESMAILGTDDFIVAMPVGGLRRSVDGGVNWNVIPSPLSEGWLGCLTKGPTGKLWACVNRHPARLLISSTDLGVTWRDEIDLALTNVRMSTQCPTNSQTQQACSTNCLEYPMICESDLADAGVPAPITDQIDAGQAVQNTQGPDSGCSIHLHRKTESVPVSVMIFALVCMVTRPVMIGRKGRH